MKAKSSERGNILLIVTVLITGLTLMGLGVARVARSYTQTAAEIRGAGYPALQALYMAEMGLNDLLYRLNEPTAVVIPPNYTEGAPLTGPTPAPYRPVLDYGAFTIQPTLSYRVTRLAEVVPNARYRYRSEGTVEPDGTRSTWPPIKRTIRFDVVLDGGYWVVKDYTDE